MFLGVLVAATLSATTPPGGAEPPTVSLDLGGLDEATYRRLEGAELERRAVMRLIEEGFAVAARTENPWLRIGLRSLPDGRISLDARSPTQTLHRELSLPPAPLGELQLEITQRVADLARASLLAKPVAPTSPPAPPPARPPAPPSFEVAVGGGALFRGAADPQLSVELRRALGPRFGAHALARFVPSSGPGITVGEAELAIGAGWRWAASERVSLEAVALVGIWAQFFSIQDPSLSSPSGSFADLNVSASFRAWIRLVPAVAVGLEGGPSLSTRGYEHTLSGQPVWSRSAFSLGFQGLVGYAF